MEILIAPPQAIWELGDRENQEDAIYPPMGKGTSENKLFILCDGMGGHERGEVASNLICDTLSSYIHEHWDGKSFDDTLLLDALNAAMDELDTINDNSDRRPGTTLTILAFHSGGVLAAHIGDSRIYHIRPSQHTVLYKSRDHSQAYDMLASGEITLDEMEKYSKKNIITRALLPKLQRRPKPSIAHITDVRPGDYFYLCSDGMLEQMSDKELVGLLANGNPDDEKRSSLIELTKDNKDNHSAYLIRIADVKHEAGDEMLKNDEKDTTSNALNLERPFIKEAEIQEETGFFYYLKTIINKLIG